MEASILSNIRNTSSELLHLFQPTALHQKRDYDHKNL